MFLSDNGKEIPPQWEHDPAMSSMYKRTVAMHLARDGIEIPTQW